MENHQTQRRYRLWWPLALVLTLWVSSSLHLSPQLPAPAIVGLDKIVHFLVYGLMGTLWVRVWSDDHALQRVWQAVLITAAAGMLEECIQYTNPARSFEWPDWVADVAGALLAVILYQYWGWYRSMLEWKISLLKK